MSISIGGSGGGGSNWFDIAYFQNYWGAADGNIYHPSALGGWNAENTGNTASVGSSWSETVALGSTSVGMGAAPLKGGSSLRIKGGFSVVTTLTGDVELHIMHGSSIDWGTSNNVNFTSVLSVVFTNPTGAVKYEIDAETTFAFAAGDRFTYIFYNRNTGVTANGRINMALWGK